MFISELGFLLVVLAFKVFASISSRLLVVPILFAAISVITFPSMLPAFNFRLFSMDPPVDSKTTFLTAPTEPSNCRSPLVAVALKFPPTREPANFKLVALTNVALPVPFVFTATVPSTASVPRSIAPLLASVVAARLPPTVTVPLSMIPDTLPPVSVKFPPTDDAPILRAVIPLSIVA